MSGIRERQAARLSSSSISARQRGIAAFKSSSAIQALNSGPSSSFGGRG